jgi:glycosyltransferase involved in cell wall biosynthesis
MWHCRGGSGSSPALDALMATNRIRYIRKFRPDGYALAFRAAVVVSAFLRTPLSNRRQILSAVSHEASWDRLPRAIRYAESDATSRNIPSGTVIIPAHNEATVIRRTLNALRYPLASGSVEVIVACNGCSDGTEEVAHLYPGVKVIQLSEASKVAALNAADRLATRWPRIYLDADVELPLDALCVTLERLAGDESIMCARPAFRYNTDGASWPVRAYYRARGRLPQASQSMWGAGTYGLNLEGHKRLGEFPAITADDCYIDRLYALSEKVTLECEPVTVRTPRTTNALVSTLRRVYRGNSELRYVPGSHTGRTMRELAKSIHGPASAFDAVVYSAFAAAGRLYVRGHVSWERDNSTRAARILRQYRESVYLGPKRVVAEILRKLPQLVSCATPATCSLSRENWSCYRYHRLASPPGAAGPFALLARISIGELAVLPRQVG